MAGSFSKIGCGGMDNPEHNPAATVASTTVRLLPTCAPAAADEDSSMVAAMNGHVRPI